MTTAEFVDLAAAGPAEAVVVIDVLRAFTVEPWIVDRGAKRILAVSEPREAFALRDRLSPDTILVGEDGGRRIRGFDFGNSPSELAGHDFDGADVVHRTSAGTRGLARTAGSGVAFAASFVNAAATARALRDHAPSRVTFVITGASLGRDGDEDLAAAELIAARLGGDDLPIGPLLERVEASDAGRAFAPAGAEWAPPADLAAACEVDRFATALLAERNDQLGAVELHVRP